MKLAIPRCTCRYIRKKGKGRGQSHQSTPYHSKPLTINQSRSSVHLRHGHPYTHTQNTTESTYRSHSTRMSASAPSSSSTGPTETFETDSEDREAGARSRQSSLLRRLTSTAFVLGGGGLAVLVAGTAKVVPSSVVFPASLASMSTSFSICWGLLRAQGLNRPCNHSRRHVLPETVSVNPYTQSGDVEATAASPGTGGDGPQREAPGVSRWNNGSV
jgi:hypothetical protein